MTQTARKILLATLGLLLTLGFVLVFNNQAHAAQQKFNSTDGPTLTKMNEKSECTVYSGKFSIVTNVQLQVNKNNLELVYHSMGADGTFFQVTFFDSEGKVVAKYGKNTGHGTRKYDAYIVKFAPNDCTFFNNNTGEDSHYSKNLANNMLNFLNQGGYVQITGYVVAL